ncbi:MAG TPA: exodeoxyribonuclease VII large subunit [Lentimicrobium sp.]|nr:exodeoxyribonuclease VII large subunit [Lentimicrobium sp.]
MVTSELPSGDFRRVFSLSEITGSIERMFRKYYPSPYWIKAEISKLNLYPQSGHCYPDLVERSAGKIRSQARGIIWKDDFSVIRSKFESVTREPLREGIGIMFLAYVRFSSEFGFSLQIIDIEPLYTLGELAREKTETIARLKREGIFNQNRLLPLPLLPQRLAVISASSSKGYSDLLVTLNANPFHYRFDIQLFHATLQGDGAVDSIQRQLQAIKNRLDDFDALLIIRGGGDEVGMACYDNYLLASEVACFPLPVITGIGHSTNETVVEMVAAVNKITPTDVAHYLIGSFRAFNDRIDEASRILHPAVNLLLETWKRQFDETAYGLIDRASGLLEAENQRILRNALAIRDVTTASVFNHRIALSRYEISIATQPAILISRSKLFLRDHVKLSAAYLRHYRNSQQLRVDNLDARVQLLDPRHVLKRGFSITRYNGKALGHDALPEAGTTIETETAEGLISSIVTESKLK